MILRLKYILLLTVSLLIGELDSFEQAVGDYGTRFAGSAGWNNPANWIVCVSSGTWTGATVAVASPSAAVNVWIFSNANVQVDISGSCKNLDVAGTLSFSPTGARTLNVTGNLSGIGTIDMSGGAWLHVLNLSGATNTITTFTMPLLLVQLIIMRQELRQFFRVQIIKILLFPVQVQKLLLQPQLTGFSQWRGLLQPLFPEH